MRQGVFGSTILRLTLMLALAQVAALALGLTVIHRFTSATILSDARTAAEVAREFAKRTHGGMVGINVGIPVPFSIFPFTGHKDSFFGDLHAMGKDGVAFFTETKAVTSVWFTEEDSKKAVSTWDGTLTRN